MENDALLAAHAAHGNREAFDELVRRHQVRTYALIHASTGGDPEAEDLVQETFLRAYRAVPDFRGDSSFRTWLHRIALNVVRSYLERRRRTPSAPSLAGGDDPLPLLEQIPSSDDLETAVVRRQILGRALATLRDEVRLLILLRDVEGLAYHEIAALTGLPIGTVESRVFRARQRLRPLVASLRG